MEEKLSTKTKNIIKERNDFIESLVKEKETVNLTRLELSKALKESQKVVNIFLDVQEKHVLTINDSNEKLAVENSINKTKIILGFYDFFITTFKKTANTKKALFKKTTRSIVFEKIIFLLIELKVAKNLKQFHNQFTNQINRMIEKIISLNKKFNYLKIELRSFQEISLIKLFYEIGVDFNQLLDITSNDDENEIKSSPLHLAVSNENYELVVAILSWGVDINVVDELGANALFIAACEGNIAIVKYLLAKGANINILADNVSTIEMVIEEKNYEILQLLIDHGAEVNIKNSEGETPIFQAIRLQKLSVIQLLIDNGADVNIKVKNHTQPIYIAIETNNIKIIQLLINSGADINSNILPLIITIMISTPPVLNLLLTNGADVNATADIDEASLLHLVIAGKKNNFIKLLIEKGININSKDKFGQTSLHLAIVKENFSAVKLLVKHGVDINIKDKRGFHALHLATLNNDIQTVSYLQKNGADINIRNNLGQTSLHLAIINNNKEVAEILTTLGANLYIKDSKGQTPFYLTQKKKTFDFIKNVKN